MQKDGDPGRMKDGMGVTGSWVNNCPRKRMKKDGQEETESLVPWVNWIVT